MPTYEYACSKCKAQYELRQGFDAPTTHKCEECGKGTAKRILHAPRVVFKGSGWYVTDSKKTTSAVADAAAPDTDGPASSEPSEAPAPKVEKPAKKESAKSSSGPEAAAAG